MPHQSNVVISSTALDLPEHRKEVLDACLRQGMFPSMMEYLPASDAEAVSISLKLVNEADVYVGVFAHRYGYIPKDNNARQLSITEMEYNRARERGIPRLIFLMDKTHPITFEDVEQGEGGIKLKTFKEKLQAENIVNFFKSPTDLRAHVINSLSKLSQPDALQALHYVSEIPTPPQPFIAHPYTLLQTRQLVGRQFELSLLTDWVSRSQQPLYQARILSVVAIGGMGKSALTWKWFTDIAPQEMKPMAGRLWWSFYESDASFENFVTRALAYVSRRPLSEVQQLMAADRERQLLAALNAEPFLIVLDGLERVLLAYARMDAAHLADDDLDRRTANVVTQAMGLPNSAAQSFTGEHQLRKTADPRVGSFLRKLANVQSSRILISTRLYPADLQAATGAPLGNCFALFLEGLTDEDALDLWRVSNVSGSRDKLVPLFRRFEKHPLLLQALAGEVSRYRRAPGDFERWESAHPGFNPFALPLVQVKSHVLTFALSGLTQPARQVLQTITAFRSPASYDTLIDLAVGEGKACLLEEEFDQVLTELEDRGLVGWDKRANRYDLHPIVRGVVWTGLEDATRQGIYTRLQMHFEALPVIDDYLQVNNLEDLTTTIELYNSLIGLKNYEEAWKLYDDRLVDALLYRLGANRQLTELLEMLFPQGLNQLPPLRNSQAQANILNLLALGYLFCGQPGHATSLFQRANGVFGLIDSKTSIGTVLKGLSISFRLSGFLYKSEVAARQALVIDHAQNDDNAEAQSLLELGQVLAAWGAADQSEQALQRALRISRARYNSQIEGLTNAYLAERAKWWKDFTAMQAYAIRGGQLASVMRIEADVIQTTRLQGEAALGLNDLTTAGVWLHQALNRARQVNRIEEELPTLIALAELSRRQGEQQEARERLEEVWEAAERGPYPLFHADALNVLAQIERDTGHKDAAIDAAIKAYQLAWCDGPPYAYHWGLVASQKHLEELGASLPYMPLFDPTKFEPMPDVEIDPEGEFHLGAANP